MSSVPVTLPTIEKLINRIATAERSNQREVKISIAEAKELTQELALMTTRLAATVQQIYTMLDGMKSSNEKVDIKFDGGGF